MTQLKVEAVSKVYKEKTALHPCSFVAEDATCIVLCGGNGAGKSTLLQILAGILAPSSGKVTIDEKGIRFQREEYLAQLGFMPDDFFAQEMMTVQEFLQFYADLRSVKKERVIEVLTLIGLLDKHNNLVKSLSKGMRQRLVFGQAILAHPKVLILDEPTNGLDPFWVNQFVEIIKEITANGAIVVFSTHMMDVAAETGDTILFMKQGEVIETIHNKQKNEETTKLLMKLHRQ